MPSNCESTVLAAVAASCREIAKRACAIACRCLFTAIRRAAIVAVMARMLTATIAARKPAGRTRCWRTSSPNSSSFGRSCSGAAKSATRVAEPGISHRDFVVVGRPPHVDESRLVLNSGAECWRRRVRPRHVQTCRRAVPDYGSGSKCDQQLARIFVGQATTTPHGRTTWKSPPPVRQARSRTPTHGALPR